MSVSLARARLFSGYFRSNQRPIRPPWAIAESRFDDICTNCGDCISACPQQIIHFGRGKLPEISFAESECTFCEECVKHCEPGCLNKEQAEQPWPHRVRISESCLSKKAVTCRTCGDYCEASAIRFSWKAGGISSPEVELGLCNGCGACINRCPTGAITVYHPETSSIPQEEIA